MRFGHKAKHTVWLEPEGYDSGMPPIYLDSEYAPQ
jgi:tRNA U34 5-carboxymethylaminomethyl modifying enzyme MnmG/GidA